MSVNSPSNIIQIIDSSEFRLVNRLSRYNVLKRVVNEEGDIYIETPTKIVIPETSSDAFYSVEKGYEDRLDLISFKFYNTPLLWWAIAEMNNISNPFDVKAGLVLRIPAMSSIYASGGLKSNA